MSEFLEYKIADLVEVPDVKTVIRIDDTKSEDMQRELIHSFVLTAEVEEALGVILGNIAAGTGKGYFLYGNFGSGKSHFLSCLSLALKYKEALLTIAEKSRSSDLEKVAKSIDAGRYLVVSLSLVNHSARESLEEIVLSAISDGFQEETGQGIQKTDNRRAYEDLCELAKSRYPLDLKRYLKEKNIEKAEELFSPNNAELLEQFFDDIGLPFGLRFNREQAFLQVARLLRENDYKGLLVIIDELSEFLRSKSNARAFNEDIRLLQFVAENAEELPCWIVAALQDKIEETGEIAPELFTKITDRYKTRFRLTGQHVKELIDKRLIVKKPGASDVIFRLYRDYKNHFAGLPFDEEEFLRVYPVHPLTVTLLDNLKNLFSQHRGIVDFIHYRLKGDHERGISGMLDRPCDVLLSADKIFDHFRNRIREISELNPYSEQVFDYFEKEVPRIFDDEEDREIALRIVRILILGAISPVQRRFTLGEIADFLVHKISSIDPEINYEYISGLLEALQLHGAYINSETGETELDRRYYISLESNVNLIINRRLEYLKGTLFENDRRIFDKLGLYVNEPYFPLKSLLENADTRKTMIWHKTQREARVILADFRDITYERLDELKGELADSDLDVVFVIGKPLGVEEQERYLENVILPELFGADRSSFVSWLPRPVDQGEILDSLRDVLAFDMLKDEFANDLSDTGKKINEIIAASMPDKIRYLVEVYRNAYFKGSMITGSGDEIALPDSLIPFDRFLENIAALMLGAKHPKHGSIAPHSEVFMQNVFQKCIDLFFRGEHKETIKITDFSAISVINNFLKPMGLVKGGEQKGFRLSVEPKSNGLVNAVILLVTDERTPLQDMYLSLRKGEYGLTKPEFQILITSMLFSGLITAFQKGRRMALSQINAYNFWNIDAIGKGQLIDEDLQRVISQVPFLPAKYKNATLTIGLQHEIWETVKDFKREWDIILSNVSTKLSSIRDYKSMSHYDIDRILSDIDGIRALLDEIRVSHSSEQGLGRFLSAYQSSPHFDSQLMRITRLQEFLDEDFDAYLFTYGYITDSRLAIPDQEKYRDIYDMHSKLVESTKSEAILFDKVYYEKFQEAFLSFRRLYISIYMNEHNRVFSAEESRKYQGIMGSQGYKTLSQLAGLATISVQNDLIKVNMQLSQALGSICNKLHEHVLTRVPVCDCGFVLGETRQRIPVSAIMDTIEKGITEYVSALKDPKNREKIERYMAGMEDIGKSKEAKAVRDLLSVDETRDLRKVSELVNRNVVDILNKALAEHRIIVERNLNELYENVINRVFSQEQLRRIFQEWLKADSQISSDTYIKVVGRFSLPFNNGSHYQSPLQTFNSSGVNEGFCEVFSEYEMEYSVDGSRSFPRGVARLVEKIVNEHFPELVGLINNYDIDKVFALCITGVWASIHELDEKRVWDVLELEVSKYEEATSLITELGWTVLSRWSEVYPESQESEVQDKSYDPGVIVGEITGTSKLAGGLVSMLFSEEDTYDLIHVLEAELLFDTVLHEASKRFLMGLESAGKRILRGNIRSLEGIYADTERVARSGKMDSFVRRVFGGQRGFMPTSGFLKIKREYLSFLLLTLQTMVQMLDLEDSPSEIKLAQFAKEYAEKYAGIELGVNRSIDLARQLGLIDWFPQKLKSTYWMEVYQKTQEVFQREYDRVFGSGPLQESIELSLAERLPTMDVIIKDTARTLVQKLSPEAFYILVMDGMREDLWNVIRTEVLDTSELIYRIADSGSMYAYSPSTTETQISVLREVGHNGRIITVDQGSMADFLSHDLKQYDNLPKRGFREWDILKFDFIDERLHSSISDPVTFVDEVKLISSKYLVAFFKKLPKKSLVFILADHGFAYYDYQEESVRYGHGGNRMEEVIVPWCGIYML